MKNLYLKLLEVQKELGAIKKDSKNPHFGNTYFDINTLIEAVKQPLISHGLLLSQPLIVKDGKMVLQTLLVDTESGETLETGMLLPDNLDPQKMGSAITYYRRYSIQSLLLIEAEDDDGNSVRPVQPVAKQAATPGKEPSANMVCPTDGGNIVHKTGKYGDFFSCSNYPTCKTTFKTLEEAEAATIPF